MSEFPLFTKTLGNPTEIINFSGCTFNVYRKKKNPNVFTLSLWKSDIGYVFNLANSLIWWANNLPKLFPEWNIRVYFDNSIFQRTIVVPDKVQKDNLDWVNTFKYLLKFPHIELWFYNCNWASSGKCIQCHRGTFGSVIRFHAFDDPMTEKIICHNLEYLTSPRDRDRTEKWLNSGKKYHWYCKWVPGGGYGSFFEEEKDDKTAIMATFSMRKEKNESSDYFKKALSILHKNPRFNNFPYGVDEYILTRLLKPKMTWGNTFVTDFINYLGDLNWIYAAQMDTLFNNMAIYHPKYTMYTIKGGQLKFLFETQNDPDFGADFINSSRAYIKRNFPALDNNEIKNKCIDKFHELLFEKFKKDESEFYTIFIFKEVEKFCVEKLGISVSNVRYLMLLMLFDNSIFNCIDFPGYCVKLKDFSSEKSVLDTRGHIFSGAVKKVYKIRK